MPHLRDVLATCDSLVSRRGDAHDLELVACAESLQAALRVATQRASRATVDQDEPPITARAILLATRPAESTPRSTACAPSAECIEAELDAIDLPVLVHAALSYYLASRPQVLVRHVSHQMDRCAGTNLSQFTFGGVALALAVDVLDAWSCNTMVVGHTKFSPDTTALPLANKYNSSDCFSLAHLQSFAAEYGRAVAYDESLLVDLHENSLFSAIPNITKHRSFLLLADDGELDLGSKAATAPNDEYPGATSESLYYKAKDLHEVLFNLTSRSFARVLDGGAREYGVGSGLYLLPKKVDSVRPVLCFMRPKEEDELFMLVNSYSSYANDAAGISKVNEALACTARPEPKSYYGAKVNQIKEMYSKYVPPQYHSKYKPSATGCSGAMRTEAVRKMRTPAENAADAAAHEVERAATEEGDGAGEASAGGSALPTASARAGRRYNRHTDDDMLLALYARIKPASTKHWKELADEMFDGCTPSQCKSAVRRLLSNKIAKSPAAAPIAAPSETLEDITVQVVDGDTPASIEAEMHAGTAHTETPVLTLLRYAFDVQCVPREVKYKPSQVECVPSQVEYEPSQVESKPCEAEYA